MSRNRRTARDTGTRFTASAANYLATQLGNDGIEPRNKNGAKDRGDITGLKFMGQRIVIECKDHGGKIQLGPWVNETEIERGNDDAGVGMVIAKRRGHGQPGDQFVVLTLRDLVSLLVGQRPE